MADAVTTIEIYQGDYVPIEIEVTENDVALDITGYTLFFMVKDDVEDLDDDAVIDITILPEDLTDPTHGITLMEITHEDSDVPVMKGRVYGFKLIDTDGNPVTFDEGKFNVIRPTVRKVEVPTS